VEHDESRPDIDALPQAATDVGRMVDFSAAAMMSDGLASRPN
jgi:hypothetical protein